MKKIDSTYDIYSTSNILKFSSVYKYFVLLLIFKTIGPNSVLKLREHSCHTRSNNVDLSLPVFRTTLFRNSTLNYGPELFNSLPQDIKLLLREGNFKKYKKELRKYLLIAQL